MSTHAARSFRTHLMISHEPVHMTRMALVRSFLVTHRLRVLVLFCSVLLPLLIVGKVADDITDNRVFPWDDGILWFMHHHASPFADSTMKIITRLGAPPLMLLMGCVGMGVLLWRKRRGDALFFFASVVGAGLLNLAAKAVFGRVRPDLWLSIAPEKSPSFPSGHAMGTMAMAAAVVILLWPTRARWFVLAGAIVFVVSIGVSRLYLGVHFPSDILAGWLSSLSWVSGLQQIRQARWPFHAKQTGVPIAGA